MATATSTTWTNVIREVYTPGRLVDVAFQNSTLFDFSNFPFDAFGDSSGAGYGTPKGLFPVVPSRGGNSWNWPVVYSTGAAEAYTEGQGAPAPGNNTLLMAQMAYSNGYFQRTVEISGHAMDQAKDEGAIIDAFAGELVKAGKALVDLLNTTALGTGNMGIQLAIDSAGTYAGIDRATYTAWGSFENALGGALSRAALDDMIEAVTDNDRGASRSDLVILCPVNQLTNYGALAGAGAGVPLMVPSGGGNVDLGFSSWSHAGIPIIGIPDATDTVVMVAHKPSCYFVMHRPLTIEEKPTGGDTKSWLLTCSVVLVVERPHLCAKQTGVTA